MKQVRCAIYTRKSSEEGLQQGFNSLDAQREACAAYILSQASEGWVELPELYDDGGISGGTLDRPALQRLLEEVAAGRVDTVVVYKVDRLTRSLTDFSKLVEIFDAAGTSFVSVTQSFNTTTSMGRLTLNMLLSFAQFEREVTAERIRDKIAASKAKGMWMGGTPPLGYEPDGRSLKVIEGHASLVREIFARYLRLGNVRHVAEELAQEGIRSPARQTTTGRLFGGVAFSRGQIYGILKCPTYVGEVHHNGEVYAGLHLPIVDRDTWDHAQAKLADNVRGHRSGVRAAAPSLLAGKVFDEASQPLIPSHACKGKVRYRYYVSRDLHAGDSTDGARIPAREIETLVVNELARLFDDPIGLASRAGLSIAGGSLQEIAGHATRAGAVIRARDRAVVGDIVAKVTVTRGMVQIVCDAVSIARRLGVAEQRPDPTLELQIPVALTRTGRALRLVHASGSATAHNIDESLIRLLARAHRCWRELRNEGLDVTALAAREGVSPSYLTRVLRLAFLSPDVTAAILAGKTRAGVDTASLTSTDAIPSGWAEQRHAILPSYDG